MIYIVHMLGCEGQKIDREESGGSEEEAAQMAQENTDESTVVLDVEEA